jgi:outer membrane lipase/esterase
MKRLIPGWALGLLTAALMVACGGGGDGDQSLRVSYGKVVSFGDSLSDVGSYAVSGVAAVGGGKYTVNAGNSEEDAIWVQRLAAQLGVAAPCAAQTGLNAIEAVVGFPPAVVTNHSGCYGYAQGGSRVTAPVGPGNVALFNVADPDTYSNAIGQLTDPVVNQITRHLAASGGSFAADDLVTVLAGGNDVFINLAVLSATISAGGDPDAAAAAAVTAMGTAGAELAGYINSMIVAHGAERVVVVNVPDVSKTPFGLALDASTQALVLTMVTTFNAQLSAGLAGESKVLLVDAFTVDQDQASNPAPYGLTNVTATACDLEAAPSSLLCSKGTLAEGATETYKFADSVHPTPYGHLLLARLVAKEMAVKGWL